MNLAGVNTKRLLRSLRTGGTPTSIGLWAAVNTVEQLRKRRKPPKALLVRKDLEPGATYVVRIPEEGQAPISATLSSGGIGSELVMAAADLLANEEEIPSAEPEAVAPAALSRRQRRRARRLERLEKGAPDLDSIPRRQRRQLGKAQGRARRRPTRRRVRRARRLQRTAAKSAAKAERKAAPSRRAVRRHRQAEEAVAGWERKTEKRSTRRRRRKLARAKKSLADD